MLELVQLSIGYMLINTELAKFVKIKIFLVVEPMNHGTKGVDHWATYPTLQTVVGVDESLREGFYPPYRGGFTHPQCR